MTMSDVPIAVLGEIDKTESDRSVAVLGAALVEDALGDLLRKILVGTKPNKDKLLKRGILADSRARSEMLYRFGKLAKHTYQNTNLIQEIRNKFAHRAIPGRSFEDQDIKNLTDKLNQTSRLFESLKPAGFDYRDLEELYLSSSRGTFLINTVHVWSAINTGISVAKQLESPANEVHS